jgi:Tfp pilus assembly protein PilN
LIQRINLLPKELRVVRKGPFYLFSLISLAIYASILCSVYSGKQTKLTAMEDERSSLMQHISLLKAQDAKYKEIIEKINLTETKKKRVEEKVRIIAAISEGRTPWADALYELSNIIPSGVWLSSLSSLDTVAGEMKAKGVKINGMAFSSSLIADLMAAIDTSPYFEGAAMTYAQKVDYHGRDAFSFELTFRLRRKG